MVFLYKYLLRFFKARLFKVRMSRVSNESAIRKIKPTIYNHHHYTHTHTCTHRHRHKTEKTRALFCSINVKQSQECPVPWSLPLRPASQGRFSLAFSSPATADPSSLLGKPSATGQGGVPRKEGEGRTEIIDVGRGWSPNQALGYREKDVL